MRTPLRYLLFLVLLSAGRAGAQVYEPGLLVRASGDTLRGEVENDFWEDPPTFIRFRRGADSPSELFRPRQLRAVSFTGGRYFRYEILQLDHAAETRLQMLPRGVGTAVQTDSVLADVLLTGPVELLRVVLPGATHYVLRRPGQPPLSLSGRQYLRESDKGDLQLVDANNYRGQLALYFSDCPAASSLAQTAKFTPAGLMAVAQAYATACSPGHEPGRSWLPQARSRPRAALQAGVLAGGRVNRIKEAAAAGECADCQVRPFGGLYTELLLPSRRAALYGELSVSAFRRQDLSYAGYGVYTPVTYQATLGTARLGFRFLVALPHDQQVVFGLGYEYNRVWGVTLARNSRYYASANDTDDTYATPTMLPNLALGWRRQRLTAMLDGQLYKNSRNPTGADFGPNLALRLGLSYRLGRSPNAPRRQP